MKHFLKVVLFSLLIIGFFAGFSNFGIPRIEPEPPPVEEKLDLSSMTMDSFIALGDRVFNGKGACTLCHNAVGGRAPMLDRIVTVTAERLADQRYQGSASDSESYILESLSEPSAYVVSGFGQAGTGDSVSPMPDAGGIGLSDAEIKAIIAYLQDLGGVEVTVAIPTDTEVQPEQQQEKPAAVAAAAPATPLTTAEAIIAKHACGACHKVADQVGQLGPDLTTIGAIRDKEYLRRSILDPNADVAEGFMANMMPPVYATQLYASELELLLDYLAELK